MIRIIKVDGLAELKDAIEELPKATGTNVMKRALINAAQPIVADAERLAPRMTGKLQQSIDASPKQSARLRRGFDKKSKVEIYVGPGDLAQATLQEFGSSHQRPQPFLRPAWQSNLKSTLESIKKELADEIKKAAARIARKAAKLHG